MSIRAGLILNFSYEENITNRGCADVSCITFSLQRRWSERKDNKEEFYTHNENKITHSLLNEREGKDQEKRSSNLNDTEKVHSFLLTWATHWCWLGISISSSALVSANNGTNSWTTAILMFSPANCCGLVGSGYWSSGIFGTLQEKHNSGVCCRIGNLWYGLKLSNICNHTKPRQEGYACQE